MNRKKILIIAGVIIIAVAGITALIKTSALNKETTEVSTEIEEITPEPTEEPTPTPEPTEEPTPTPGPTPEATEEAEELEYIEEAKELWQEHKEEFICNDETFREAYIAERASGSDKEEAYETVYELFKKEEEQKEEVKESEGKTTEQKEETTEQTPAPTEAPQQTSQSEPSSQDSGLDPSDPSSLSRLLGVPDGPGELPMGTGDGNGAGGENLRFE